MTQLQDTALIVIEIRFLFLNFQVHFCYIILFKEVAKHTCTWVLKVIT